MPEMWAWVCSCEHGGCGSVSGPHALGGMCIPECLCVSTYMGLRLHTCAQDRDVLFHIHKWVYTCFYPCLNPPTLRWESVS